MFNELEFYSRNGEGFKLNYTFFQNYNSKNTRKAYSSDLKQFSNFFYQTFKSSLMHPKQVEKFHIVAFKEYLVKIGGLDGAEGCPKSIGRKIGALNSYFKFLVENDVIKVNPCEGVKRPKQVVKTETNGLSDDQVKDLLSSLNNKTLTNSLYKAILFVLFGTGIRVSELVNLKREDFGKRKGIKVIRFKSKGGDFRILPVKHEISKEIEEYLLYMSREGRKHKKTDPLFQPSRNGHTKELTKPLHRSTILRIFQKCCRDVGIFDRVSPHSARATLISSLLEKGVDLYKVSLAAGHANPQTTKNYDKRGKKLEESAILELDYFSK